MKQQSVTLRIWSGVGRNARCIEGSQVITGDLPKEGDMFLIAGLREPHRIYAVLQNPPALHFVINEKVVNHLETKHGLKPIPNCTHCARGPSP